MFEHMTTHPESEKTKDFIDLYTEFHRSGVLIRQGKADGHEKFRFRKLEGKIDSLWSRIPDAERKVIWKDLIVKKMIPEEVRGLVEDFNGRVVSLVAGRVGV